jgi:hypothetical protein
MDLSVVLMAIPDPFKALDGKYFLNPILKA